MKINTALLLSASLLALTQPAWADGDHEIKNVTETICSYEILSNFCEQIRALETNEFYSNVLAELTDPYTVFAPVDSNEFQMDINMPDGERLFRHQFVNEAVYTYKAKNRILYTLATDNDWPPRNLVVKLTRGNDGISRVDYNKYQDQAIIMEANIKASNGVVHIVNRPSNPVPPTAFWVMKGSRPTIPNGPEQLWLQDYAEAVERNPNQSTRTYLEQELADFGGGANFTVFVPTDEAFGKFNQTILTDPKYQEQLLAILDYHIIPDRWVWSKDFENNLVLPTRQGQKVLIERPSFWRSTINDAKILSTDIIGLHCVLHSIDRVLVPLPEQEKTTANGLVGTARLMPSLTIMTSLLTSPGFLSLLAELQHSENEFTVFAPDDYAFAMAGLDQGHHDTEALLNVLKYHLVPNELTEQNKPVIFVDTILPQDESMQRFAKLKITTHPRLGTQVSDGLHSASIVLANLTTRNGVIHVLDKVLTPPGSPSRTLEKLGLTAFSQALRVHGLTREVDMMKEVTIFAPTNEAFTKGKMVPEYHVVQGVVYYDDLRNHQKLKTIAGDYIQVRKDYNTDEIWINDARISQQDVMTNNGLIHTINKAIYPAQELMLRPEYPPPVTQAYPVDTSGFYEPTDTVLVAPPHVPINAAYMMYEVPPPVILPPAQPESEWESERLSGRESEYEQWQEEQRERTGQNAAHHAGHHSVEAPAQQTATPGPWKQPSFGPQGAQTNGRVKKVKKRRRNNGKKGKWKRRRRNTRAGSGHAFAVNAQNNG